MKVQLKDKGNTKLINENGVAIVRLYSTPIVSITPDSIILNTGGYETTTTKNRMNQVSEEYGLGFQVYQEKYVWFVAYKGVNFPFNGDTVTLAR